MSDLKYIKKETISVFHAFLPEEAEQAKQAILRLIDSIEETEEEKKSIVSELGSKLKSLKLAFGFLARDLKRNGEDRELEALLYFDFHNCQRIYKNSRGEILLTLPFKEDDYNMPIPLISLDEEYEEVTNYEDLPDVTQRITDIKIETNEFGKLSIKKKKK
jgi:hypothetical protein